MRTPDATTLVFIPAWNEAESVTAVVQSVREALPEVDIAVIDDGSQDATSEVARAARAVVTPAPFNQGLGAALETGYLYAQRHGYEFIAHCDSDGLRADGLDRAIEEYFETGSDARIRQYTEDPVTSRLIAHLDALRGQRIAWIPPGRRSRQQAEVTIVSSERDGSGHPSSFTVQESFLDTSAALRFDSQGAPITDPQRAAEPQRRVLIRQRHLRRADRVQDPRGQAALLWRLRRSA